jgi:hypothetical protein
MGTVLTQTKRKVVLQQSEQSIAYLVSTQSEVRKNFLLFFFSLPRLCLEAAIGS